MSQGDDNVTELHTAVPIYNGTVSHAVVVPQNVQNVGSALTSISSECNRAPIGEVSKLNGIRSGCPTIIRAQL